MTQTIKERLEELKRDEDACEDCEECDIYELCIRTRLNKAHNAGVDACLPLLEEVEALASSKNTKNEQIKATCSFGDVEEECRHFCNGFAMTMPPSDVMMQATRNLNNQLPEFVAHLLKKAVWEDRRRIIARVDACLPLLEAEYRQGFDDGMKHREFLICHCGCPMKIDAKDYQENHSGEALTPPTK